MQVNLTQDEIAKAVKLFLKEQGIKLQNKDVSIQFSMGKGVNGLKSEVNIEDNPNAPVVVDEDPVRVLDTVREEPEIKPSSVNALIKRHAEEVVAKTAATVEVKPEVAQPAAEELAAATEAQGQAIDAAIAAEDEPNMGMPSDPPFTTDVIQNGDQQLAAEPAAEVVPVAEVTKAVRKAIFGKKAAAAVVPDPAPEPAQAEDDSAALAMPGDEEVKPEVVAELAKPAVATGPRRSAASLFKKPSA